MDLINDDIVSVCDNTDVNQWKAEETTIRCINIKYDKCLFFVYQKHRQSTKCTQNRIFSITFDCRPFFTCLVVSIRYSLHRQCISSYRYRSCTHFITTIYFIWSDISILNDDFYIDPFHLHMVFKNDLFLSAFGFYFFIHFMYKHLFFFFLQVLISFSRGIYKQLDGFSCWCVQESRALKLYCIHTIIIMTRRGSPMHIHTICLFLLSYSMLQNIHSYCKLYTHFTKSVTV